MTLPINVASDNPVGLAPEHVALFRAARALFDAGKDLPSGWEVTALHAFARCVGQRDERASLP